MKKNEQERMILRLNGIKQLIEQLIGFNKKDYADLEQSIKLDQEDGKKAWDLIDKTTHFNSVKCEINCLETLAQHVEDVISWVNTDPVEDDKQ